MGVLTTLFERRSLENPAVPITDASLLGVLSGPPSATGRTVSQETALQASAVFACVRVRAETVASLPWPVYRRLPAGGKERDPRHPLYELLHDAPNPEMTAIEFREHLVGHLDLWGHAYAEIEWGPDGQVRALWPLRPDRVVEEARNGRRYYVVTLPDGSRKGLPASRVWHTRGFLGKSVIAQAREAIGLGMAGEEYGARFFSNDSRPGGVLRHPGRLTPEAATNLKNSWEALQGGLSNAHRVAVLEEGVEWQATGIAPDDAQYLELRQFQVVDIARFFRVPPHKIADLARATFANIEHQSIEFVVDCIRPICVRLEQSARRCLLRGEERQTFLAEHVIDGLLRGDIQSRYNAYAVGRQWGWLNADEVRALENLNPLPDGTGQEYLVPMNMGDAAEPREEPSPEEEEAPEDGAARAARAVAPLLADAWGRICRREEADVMRQARRMADPVALAEWLDGYYAEHLGYCARALGPVYEALGALGAAPGDPLEGARAHVEGRLGALRAVLADGGDVPDALQARFDDWREEER